MKKHQDCNEDEKDEFEDFDELEEKDYIIEKDLDSKRYRSNNIEDNDVSKKNSKNESNNKDIDEDEDSEDLQDLEEDTDLIDSYDKALNDYKKQIRAYKIQSEDYKIRTRRGIREKFPIPPVPPLPPIAPIDIFNNTVSKILETDRERVIGIRGLDETLYKQIRKYAKQLGWNVSDLVNQIFAQYLADSGFGSQAISGLDSLEINYEMLLALEDSSIILDDIKFLVITGDVTTEAFKKIKSIRFVETIYVPTHLYLHALRVAKRCGEIIKYQGNKTPKHISKNFSTDVKLSDSFFDYFRETGEKISLDIKGNLEIDESVDLEDLSKIIHSLRVAGNIRVPTSLIGWIYAKAECNGNICDIGD